MRAFHTSWLGILVLGIAIADSAAAAPAATQQLPGSEQIMHQQVGGTHIPRPATPDQLKNPYEGNASAAAEGRSLFNAMNCSGCHAKDAGGGMGPPLGDKDWIYGGEPGQIYLSILQGRPNGMPSFEKALPPDALWKLVTYIRTLGQSPSEPIDASPPAKQTGKAH